MSNPKRRKKFRRVVWVGFVNNEPFPEGYQFRADAIKTLSVFQTKSQAVDFYFQDIRKCILKEI